MKLLISEKFFPWGFRLSSYMFFGEVISFSDIIVYVAGN